jgi:hypothetical protein
VSSLKYEVGFYIPEDDILHSHRRRNLKSYKAGDDFYVLQCGIVKALIIDVSEKNLLPFSDLC